MEEIGLFPLELVLLPTERIALHIFEPRYRELVGECLEAEREFGLVLQLDDGVAETGTRAHIAKVLQVLDDGRMNIVVEGRERFRIVEVTAGRSFVTAEVEPVADQQDEPAPETVERALALFRRLIEATESAAEEPDRAGALLSFDLAARIDFPLDVKQELLELRSPRLRFERTIELLEEALEAVESENELRRRASGNGKVTKLGDPS
jgi:Lon protease-like protein